MSIIDLLKREPGARLSLGFCWMEWHEETGWIVFRWDGRSLPIDAGSSYSDEFAVEKLIAAHQGRKG